MLKKFSLSLLLCFTLPYILSENDVTDSNFEVSLSENFYTQIQFPQCSPNLDSLKIEFEGDYASTSQDAGNKNDHKLLENQSKTLRDFQKKIIDLKKKNEHERLLEVSDQALAFVNDSHIFRVRFLKQYDPTLLGFFSLRGYRMDFLSALQFTTLSIINLSFEAAKILQNEELTKKWARTGLKFNRWIHKYRGCFAKLGNRLNVSAQKELTIVGGNLCHLNTLFESIFAESLALAYMNDLEFDDAINFASLSLTAIQITPESQRAFKSAAIQRLNNLARLAYSANQNKNWCLSYEAFDRALKLAKEVGVEPLQVWKDLKSEAAENYLPTNESKWTARYGMLTKMEEPIYVPVKQIPPKYPSQLLSRGIEGCVMLRFDLTVEGKPQNIEVDWSTNDRFNRSAIRAANQFLFSPPYNGGKPSGVENARTVIVYKIDSKKSRVPGYLPPGCE